MWRLCTLLLLRSVSSAEECANAPFTDRPSSVNVSIRLRLPRSSPALADIVGLDEAKEVLREAIVLPSAMPTNVARLFRHSGERSAVLLVGPAGLGKAAAAEAAASAAGAVVMVLPATQVGTSSFCRDVLATAADGKQPVVVIVEALDTAPKSALTIQQCLREAHERDETVSRIFFVATMSHELSTVSSTALVPFGYVVQLGLPSEAERKQFLLRLLQQISRIDPQWASALREAEHNTLVNLTAKYTFGEIELVVRRAFVRSTNAEGTRDTVALHHFEQILAGMPPQASEAFNETVAEPATAATAAGEPRKSSKEDEKKKKSKDSKDPMESLFGWLNIWLPEALHLPPVVWAMIIFGILAHFMARSTYQPYGHRKRRGGGAGAGAAAGGAGGAGGPRSSLFSDLGGMGGGPGGAGFPSFGDSMNDWYSGGAGGPGGMDGPGGMGGSPFGNFPPPPGMMRPGSGAGGGGGAEGRPSAAAPSSAGMPSAGEPTVAGPQ